MKYRYQVNTFGDPKDSWAGNAVTFNDKDSAASAAANLFQRWTAVKFWRVVDETDKVVVEQDLLKASKGDSP